MTFLGRGLQNAKRKKLPEKTKFTLHAVYTACFIFYFGDAVDGLKNLCEG